MWGRWPRGLGLALAFGGCCFHPVPSGGLDAGSDAGVVENLDAGGRNCGTCALRSIWIGDLCVAQDCAVAGLPEGRPCLLSDGGMAQCLGGVCIDFLTDSANCGGVGLFCPIGATCRFGVCVPTCDSTNCPPETFCDTYPNANYSGFCLLENCGGASD